MAKRTQQMVERDDDRVPDFVQESDLALGKEPMKEYRVIQRIKIVQKSAGPEILSQFEVGTTLISSTGLVLSEPTDEDGVGEPFEVITLLFYPEWMTVNDIKNTSAPFIRHRTLDKRDPIVALARDPERREQEDPDNRKFKIRHTEVLNFVWIIDMPGHPAHGEIVVAGFARAEHTKGRNLCSLLTGRKAPFFGQRLRVTPRRRPPRNGGDWWGLDVASAGFVQDREQYEKLKEMHIELQRLLDEQRIRSDEDADVHDPAAVNAADADM